MSTDKERIMTLLAAKLVYKLYYAEQIHSYAKPVTSGGFSCDAMVDLKPGDLVACLTNNYHDFSICEVVQATGYSSILGRELGTNRTSHIYNESFIVLKDVLKEKDLYFGRQRKMYEKLVKACNDHRLYGYRLYPYVDRSTKEATIRFREMFKDDVKEIKLTGLNLKTSKKSIVEQILKQIEELP